MILPSSPEGSMRRDSVSRANFSPAKVNRVVAALSSGAASQADVRTRWLEAVATRVANARPDLAKVLVGGLGVVPQERDHLEGLSIGEIGVCYEALLSVLDRTRRKISGQFFTPDDAAEFMAIRASAFEFGTWIDPCCGVGNLAWHLAKQQTDPAGFVRSRLILIDRDATALATAVALVAADFLAMGDEEGALSLAARSVRRDFLTRGELPEFDFAIMNPPYARAEARSNFETGKCRDLFAYFTERIAKQSRGFVAVTPAAYLSAPKFQPLRDVLNRTKSGGQVYVFDNVPDTLFRGYKFGSNNTSKTNFVRAAITVCAPGDEDWRITPILRWQVSARLKMFAECESLLQPRKIGPHGEWVKLIPGIDALWDALAGSSEVIADLLAPAPSDHVLEVGLTPRYYISATHRPLERGSKATLYFRSEFDRDRAAMVLNSSVPYLWWRALDGGVTLPKRVLLSVPVPSAVAPDRRLLERLRSSEQEHLVVKLNAGRGNENVKHPADLVAALNARVLPKQADLRLLYASSMFPLAE